MNTSEKPREKAKNDAITFCTDANTRHIRVYDKNSMFLTEKRDRKDPSEAEAKDKKEGVRSLCGSRLQKMMTATPRLPILVLDLDFGFRFWFSSIDFGFGFRFCF